MNERPDARADAQVWIERAEHDYRAAQHMVDLIEEGLTDILSFHCQQCAEKYLKALLVFHGVSFPKTHDLRLLVDLVPKGVPLGVTRERIVPLNRYTIEGRYPGEWEPITPDEARAALAMAGEVREAIRRVLT
jgi:HEPN domain-containing protein